MVATRSKKTGGKPESVELNEHGQETHQKPTGGKILNSTDQDGMEVGVDTAPPKKETKGRKKGFVGKLDDGGVKPADETPKIERRGRKRKSVVDGENDGRQHISKILHLDDSVSLLGDGSQAQNDDEELLGLDSKKWGQLPIKPSNKSRQRDNSTSIISSRIDNDKKRREDYGDHFHQYSTSIISHKIDEDAPLMNLTDTNDTETESMNTTPQPNDDESKIKRKYKIDRNNIRINKRIMSKDTEDVIKMFKKFDNEVLTNAEAKSRLLTLGFETRKRYITTFKHYIRFCCKKNLKNFFVTGELMKEFYEEQFTKSSSDKPVIRLRKMDPAFSKLQEINFLVYHLPTKEIPNRHVALEYLIFKETGKVPNSKKKNNNFEINTFHQASIPSPPLSQDDVPEIIKKIRKRTINKEETINFIKNSFLLTRRNIDSIVREKLQLLHNTDMNNLVDTINSLLTGIYGQLDSFNNTIGEPPLLPRIQQQIPEDSPENEQEQQEQPENEDPSESQSEPQSGSSKVETSTNVPKFGMNHDIYTIYQILEEWRVDEPTIEYRVENYGTDWIVDKVDLETYNDRKLIVGFIDRISEECDEPDKFTIANDCDKYIRDKSILDEFISEIELDEDDLFKRIVRYRQKRS